MSTSISSGARVNDEPCSRCGKPFYSKTRAWCHSCNNVVWKRNNHNKSTRTKAEKYTIHHTTAEEWDCQLMSHLRREGLLGVSSLPRIIERGSEEFLEMEKLYGGKICRSV